MNPKVGIGLTHVDTFRSDEGVPMYKNHKYELLSVYNNPTHSNADSMASAFLGLDDPEFVHPAPGALARRFAALFVDNELVIHTTAGEFTAVLARDAAPVTSIQVSRLALDGAFDNAVTTSRGNEIRITVAATPEVRKLLAPAGSDRGLLPEAGTIAYCGPGPAANEIALRILTANSPVTQARCVGFGRVVAGAPVVRAIHDAPPGVSAFVRRIDTR